MHRLLRDTHLLVGLFLSTTVLVFGVSAIQFSHKWFSAEPQRSEFPVSVDPLEATTPRALASYLLKTTDLRGNVSNIRQFDGGRIHLQVSRMGTVDDVDYVQGDTIAHVSRSYYPFISMLIWMHSTFGFDHEYTVHNVWGALMLLLSVGLLVLGATGVYLWFKMYKERLLGSVLLASSLVFGVIMISILYAA
ncbi:MAG: hypothetical protein VX733_02730 [Candidatus Latescibacterota bacterium]|nr:hypothetical protein [Candidatus Latescibacterota bacterium]